MNQDDWKDVGPDSDFVRSLAAATAARQGDTSHPDVAQLTQYHEQRLGAAERERVQEHLASCAECAAVVLEFASFAEPEEIAEARPGRSPSPAAWESLEARVTSRAAPSVARIPPRPSLPWHPAIAALLVAVVGLSLWVVSLRRQVAELARPRSDVLLTDLMPQGANIVRQEGVQAVTRVPSWARRVVLIFNLMDDRSFPAWKLKVFASVGSGESPATEPLWQGPVRRGEDGFFLFAVERGFLPAGVYRFELLGLPAAGGEESVARYEARIEYP